MIHDAVRKAYPNAIVVNGNDETDILAWDADGVLITIDWTLISEAEAQLNGPLALAAMKAASIERVKELRRVVFAALAGLQSEALATGDTATAAAIVPVQEALRNLPAISLSACQTQADIDAAFRNAWNGIVAITPLNVVSAFNGVL